MQADAFFEQGVTHEVCEDYAIAGDNYVIVSDGCSNGGGPRIDSDWGSRIICKSAEQHIKELSKGTNVFLDLVGVTAKMQLSLFPNLSIDCLTATLVLLYVHDADFLRGIIVGDGVMGGRKRDGSWQIRNYEYLPGGTTNSAAPFYLKYRVMNEIQMYEECFGGNLKVTEYNGDLFGEGGMTQTETIVEGHKLRFCEDKLFPVSEYDFVFAASDGVSSFYRQVKTDTSKYNESVDILDVLKVILDVRTQRPGFLRLQRQWAFKRAMSGTFKQREWHNSDDVSVGGIFV